MSDEAPRDDPVGQTPSAGVDLSASPGAQEPADGAGAEMAHVAGAEAYDVEGAETDDVGGATDVATTAVHEMPREGEAGSETYLGAEHRPRRTPERALGDFTTTPSLLRLVPLGIAVGILAAGISLALLDMIGFFTNVFYYQRLSVHLTSPNANSLGAIALVIPIGGGLIVGLMARYGSEQIRGHGIPEAHG